ncbi:hypothetical protein [Paenibacillus sp.]|uniref:hypothetical protein n=1 Tax=Paenibacillus sp. TaxID=58172 RepID=UPI002810C6C2|nr:hypothetical protein [Paenibacillus sp.]
MENPEIEPMAAYTAQRVIDSLLHANQFLNFSNRDTQELKGIYLRFANDLLSLTKDAENAFREHYRKIREFLIRTNGQAIFAKYKENAHLFDVACAQ